MRFPGPPEYDWPGRHPYPGPHPGAHRGPSPRARLLVPVVLALVVQVPGVFLTVVGRHLGVLDLSPAVRAATLALAVAGPLLLLARRRFPGPTVVGVVAVASMALFVGDPNNAPPNLALAFAIVSAVVHGARLWAWISVAAGWVLTLTAAIATGATWSPARIILTTFGILVVFGLGEAARTRRDGFAQLMRVRAERHQTEIQAERVRIARELHDVLAHSLSQINVQAGVGLHLLESHPQKAGEALANIKETSKSALDEVRSVLGVLRSEPGSAGGDDSAPLIPEPDLARLAGLVSSVSAQGVAVTLSELPSEVPQATQLAIYRIVQESLTNVLRHARAQRASVDVSERDGFLTITIDDDGVAHAPPANTEGRGLLGMRERAELLGGALTTGRSPLGGMRIEARIPRAPRGSAT